MSSTSTSTPYQHKGVLHLEHHKDSYAYDVLRKRIDSSEHTSELAESLRPNMYVRNDPVSTKIVCVE